MDFRNLRFFPRRDGSINEESNVMDQTDPATESNQHEEQHLHDAIGVGANAGSMVDMAFVAPDPLSELVWSPHKGLSLKCADFSFLDRKPSVLRGAGSSNQTLTHEQSVPGKKCKQVQPRISKPSSKNDCDNKHISSRSSGGNIVDFNTRPRHIIETGIGDGAKEMNEADGVSSPSFKREEEDLHDCLGKEIAAPIENKSLSFPGCVDESKIKVESVVKEELELDGVELEKPAEFTREDSREGLGQPTRRIDCALASDIHVRQGCQASASLPSSRSLEKRESTAENELLNINVEALESVSQEPVEKLKHAGERAEAHRSPSFTRTHKKRKRGKEKALSDGYGVGTSSNSNDGNDECLESCAGSSSKGGKGGYEQQLAIGNKRFQTQIHGLTSFKGQDSSFGNWIANMIKSSPNSMLENQSSLALIHAHSDNALGGSNKQLVAVYESSNTTPLAFHTEDNISRREALVRKEKLGESSSGNENLNESVSENGKDVHRYPNMLCFDHGGCDKNQMTVSGRKKVACDPLATIDDAEDLVSDVRSGVKTSPGSGYGEDHLKSLWISRLSVKTTYSAVNLDSEPQTSDKPKSTGKREIQGCAVDRGCSSCLDRTGRNDDQSSLDKFNPMLSTRFRRSEAMASILAKRFDALKHILSNVGETSTEERRTCFFCGSRDHHLQNCSKIDASEAEHLSKISSFFGMSGADSCLCVACFQLDHWAVSCPSALLRTEHSFVNHFRNTEKQAEPSALNSKFLIGDGSNETFRQLQYNSFVDKLPPSDGQEVFDTMKKLQLSRTDIIRWMNSNMSLSKLEGLFLRLRLGKWERGFRGTGYHVAFITGSQNARNSISVKVGEVECRAKSHCVSNQAFLEEELRGWWEATSRDGSRVIVEADLEARIEKKRLLGL